MSATARHTPGPLRIVPAGQRAALKVAHAILETESGERVADVRLVPDAKLFAAAPDGLALAYAVAAHFKNTDAPLGQMARAFIAKATGEQP